jgi:hypothetical protein
MEKGYWVRYEIMPKGDAFDISLHMNLFRNMVRAIFPENVNVSNIRCGEMKEKRKKSGVPPGAKKVRIDYTVLTRIRNEAEHLKKGLRWIEEEYNNSFRPEFGERVSRETLRKVMKDRL